MAYIKLLKPKGYEHNSAFTFIEVSIGIAIISMIVGLAVVGVSTAKSDSQARKRNATITSVEQAKNRYYLTSPDNILGQETQLEHIAPYLTSGGETIGSLFDLVEGTGKPASDLDLGSYQVRPANFRSEAGDGGGNNTSGPNTPPFDVNNPTAARAALQQLAEMDPNDPEYQDILDGLNEAVALGTIDPSELSDAGLAEYNGIWMNPEVAQELTALDAHNSLTSGENWENLSAEEQTAYANLFPVEAVSYGGAGALNLMNPSILTPELVDGYGNVNGTWIAPQVYADPSNIQASSASALGHPNFFDHYITHYGWENSDITHLTTQIPWNYDPSKQWWQQNGFTIFVATDPLAPAIPLATVSPRYYEYPNSQTEQAWQMQRVGTPTGAVQDTSFYLPTYDHDMVAYQGVTRLNNDTPPPNNVSVPPWGVPIKIPPGSKVFLINNQYSGISGGLINYTW
jgi:competence protein ComGC